MFRISQKFVRFFYCHCKNFKDTIQKKYFNTNLFRAVNAIVIPVNNRPAYFSQALLSIVENPLCDWTLFFSLEPTKATNTQIEIIQKLASPFRYRIRVNSEILGVRVNSFSALEWALATGSSNILYLEDDIMVSPDMIFLVSWYFSQCHDYIMCLNLLHGACGGILNTSIDKSDEVLRTKFFNSLGFAITKSQWNRYFFPHWFDDNHGYVLPCGTKAVGWDWAVFKHNFSKCSSLATFQPRLARANHIGRENGTHCTPSFHDKIFAPLSISKNRTRCDYRILN